MLRSLTLACALLTTARINTRCFCVTAASPSRASTFAPRMRRVPADIYDIKAGIRFLRAKVIVSYFGASDLTTILAQSTPAGLEVRKPALERLFGVAPDKAPELAKLASPVFHVDRDDPPAFLLHGDQDTQMPVNQLLELKWAYENVGRSIDMLILHGVDHVAPPFFAGKPVDQVVQFLERNLR